MGLSFSAGLERLEQWMKAAPSPRLHNFPGDMESLNQWNADGHECLKDVVSAPEQGDEYRRVVRRYHDTLAGTRARFAATHGTELYAALTKDWTEMVRVEELVRRAAERYPGLAPSPVEMQADASRALPDKHGHELSQGLLLGELLAIPEVGRHLMAAMRRPRPDSLSYLNEFRKSGELHLGVIKLVRKENVGYLTLSNRDYLNAEDDELNAAMESAVDLVLLDPDIEVGVIRGDAMEHEKYRGRRVFCSGINLTKLYRGKLSYLFYVSRELGLVSKIFRGLSGSESAWNDAPDRGSEKPWIAAVDTHAIGGGCQLVLVMDYVIAESGAYFTIPARTEGFIPGVANLRLPRFMGQRLANRMIFGNYKLMADSDEGRKLVDEVVDSNSIDDAIKRVVEEISGMGTRGMISNRKAFRHGAEPLDVFRSYMATFCCEQARCMHDPEIIRNLENFWVRRSARTQN